MAKYLKNDDLGQWLAELGTEYKIHAPVQEGRSIAFRPLTQDKILRIDRHATIGPKEILFPACEELMHFSYEKDTDNPGREKIRVQPADNAVPTLIFGSRPCDARGFDVFDGAFTQCAVKDNYYAARREQAVVVSIACTRTENTCFCNWVGGSPDGTNGSDVLLTPIQDGFVVQPVTEKGETLLQKGSLLTGAAPDQVREAEQLRAAACASLPEAPDFKCMPEQLYNLFDNMDFWEKQSAKCISCGACTYLCPTCHCFNITDERNGNEGERLRSWDNCMSRQFTQEASGHNPRPEKAYRLKNRVGHKFCYFPDLHEGHIACVGCGRCIKSCPVSLDIRQVVTSAKECHLPAEETDNE
ncbi:4Fe-4S dicluster domain-containing protein [Pseudodesulfovibrio senegalensis]|uniref:Hydrogenase n=1 Tax=Pseudodesulfovibrio senegalensis TaxID=1721087 RepID=A0A6N6N585_9BACT|nr:4Fe-4S dicluster domain-containing protein [Pseudodesulfovibrio senegalensis]KAB1442408.1 hydrogenase [Pseudodesulfovibrio senegalensis]